MDFLTDIVRLLNAPKCTINNKLSTGLDWSWLKVNNFFSLENILLGTNIGMSHVTPAWGASAV